MTTNHLTLTRISDDLATLQNAISEHLVKGSTPSRDQLLELLNDVEETQRDLEQVISDLERALTAASAVIRVGAPCLSLEA